MTFVILELPVHTPETLCFLSDPPWPSPVRRGVQPWCGPAQWSAPMVFSCGMVAVGRSDGKQYGILGALEEHNHCRSLKTAADVMFCFPVFYFLTPTKKPIYNIFYI